MIGNVMNAGQASWDDVRMLLRLAQQPDAIVDKLQALIASAKDTQKAALSQVAQAEEMKAQAVSALHEAKNAAEATVAKLKALDKKQIELNVRSQELDVRANQLSEKTTELGEREEQVILSEQAAVSALASAEKREQMAATLEATYQAKLEELRRITG